MGKKQRRVDHSSCVSLYDHTTARRDDLQNLFTTWTSDLMVLLKTQWEQQQVADRVNAADATRRFDHLNNLQQRMEQQQAESNRQLERLGASFATKGSMEDFKTQVTLTIDSIKTGTTTALHAVEVSIQALASSVATSAATASGTKEGRLPMIEVAKMVVGAIVMLLVGAVFVKFMGK